MKNKTNNQMYESINPIEKKYNLIAGKVVARYNIVKAVIEYYLIRPEEMEAYRLAVMKQDLTASRKLGRQINL